jgi:hypothetical protein
MSFSMASLLIHSEVVPARARDALKAAHGAGAERRGEMLESAARALYEATDLDCRDARELVDLPPEGCCG